ncbi:MAG: DNA polymerase III subunit gamma/tau [Muribaculaceae bacterium]|nr:DNA polymerase III subunit gamma/tau [Muribaculaceae bacterium]
MEQYIVSARKYRPSTFASVVGQKTLASTLKNAIATDRLAHAYLFCGSRGVGKTSCARIFAKTINCTNRTPDGEPCNECPSCKSFNDGNSMNIVELDAASHNGIDDIKNIVDQVQVPPTAGKYRVFIIDEVHMLSNAAFNAFLKTLEEPPSYVIFILATTEKHKIIPTILSRCQIYDFNRISISDMVDHLAYVAAQEGYKADKAALNVIARKADGAMRDALSIFDQVAASAKGDISYQAAIDNLNVLDSTTYNRLLDAFNSRNLPEALLIYQEVRDKGFDSLFFVNGLAQYLRDIMVAQNPATLPLLEATDEIRNEMAQRAQSVAPQWLYGAIDLLNDVDLNYRASSNKQLLVELALIRLCQLLSPLPKAYSKGLDPIAATVAPGGAAPLPDAQTLQAARTTDAKAEHRVQQAAPAAATTHSAPRVSPPRFGPGIPGPGLSLRHSVRQETAPKTEVTLRDKTFTSDDVHRLWSEYIDSHPTERFLVATMRKSTPTNTGGAVYSIEAEEGVMANSVFQHLDVLHKWMRDRLENDHFELSVNVTVSPDSPSVWTERQVYEYMVGKSEALAELISSLKLSLD